jgi:hypothetical protein
MRTLTDVVVVNVTPIRSIDGCCNRGIRYRCRRCSGEATVPRQEGRRTLLPPGRRPVPWTQTGGVAVDSGLAGLSMTAAVVRRHLTWVTSVDGWDHAVTDAAMVAGVAGAGEYVGICEAVFLPDAMVAPPGRCCVRCSARLRHPSSRPVRRASRRHRRGRHARSSLLRRVFLWFPVLWPRLSVPPLGVPVGPVIGAADPAVRERGRAGSAATVDLAAGPGCQCPPVPYGPGPAASQPAPHGGGRR